MKFVKSLFLLCMVCWSLNAAAELQISEIMQANINSLYADNEFPDSWVELYNAGTTNFRMAGYRLGDSPDFDKAARISGGAVARAGQYFVIYCDKTQVGGYHVDFRLDSGKGSLYLFNPLGEIVDKVDYKKMLGPNVAYGLVGGAPGTWAFLGTPTPGAPNSSDVITQTLPEPVFSRQGFVHGGSGGSFLLTLSVPSGVTLPSGTRLYYTTDGSEPTTESKNTATSVQARITSTTVIRAKLIAPGVASPMATTQSYIFHPRKFQMPVISINTDSKYFNDAYMGILVGENYKQDWRRPINIEYFTAPDQPAVANQMGECRVHGAYTRVMPQKSLAVYTQKRFGNKRFNVPFWDAKPEVTQVKSFVLRNGGNCFNGNRLADQAGQTLFGRNATDLDYMENTEVIAYVNGEYKGIYDLRERSNEDNIEANYGGLEDIDMVENYLEVKEGTIDSFNNLMALVKSNPTYEQMNAAVDFENFAKTVIVDAFVTNTDWPGNNMVMWRPRAEGGKWRMVIKDLDFYASNGTNSTFFNFLLRTNGHEGDTGEGNNPERVKIFQVLWQYPQFRDLIINHLTVYSGDFLRRDLVRKHIENLRDEMAYEYEYYYHLQAYGKPLGYNSWVSQVENLISWSENRADFILNHLTKEYFNLGNLIPLKVITNGEPVKMLDIPLTQSEFIGNYYEGRPLPVFTPNHGWKATFTYTNGSTRTIYSGKKRYETTPSSAVKSIQLEVDLNTVIETLPGDVNDDGEVDVADINILISIMLGEDSADNYGGRADVTGDGGVDVDDINSVINIILGL